MDVAVVIFMCHVVCKNFHIVTPFFSYLCMLTYTSFKLCHQDRSGPGNADVCHKFKLFKLFLHQIYSHGYLQYAHRSLAHFKIYIF